MVIHAPALTSCCPACRLVKMWYTTNRLILTAAAEIREELIVFSISTAGIFYAPSDL